MLVLTGGAAEGSDSGWRIVLDRSIAGVPLGASRAAAESRLGRGVLVATRHEGSGAEPRVWVETRLYRDLLVTYVRPKAAPAAQGRVAMLDTHSAGYRTALGLGVGSPWSAVLLLKTSGSLGPCTAWMLQCQHGGDPATGGRLTVFFRSASRRIARIVIAYGH